MRLLRVAGPATPRIDRETNALDHLAEGINQALNECKIRVPYNHGSVVVVSPGSTNSRLNLPPMSSDDWSKLEPRINQLVQSMPPEVGIPSIVPPKILREEVSPSGRGLREIGPPSHAFINAGSTSGTQPAPIQRSARPELQPQARPPQVAPPASLATRSRAAELHALGETGRAEHVGVLTAALGDPNTAEVAFSSLVLIDNGPEGGQIFPNALQDARARSALLDTLEKRLSAREATPAHARMLGACWGAANRYANQDTAGDRVSQVLSLALTHGSPAVREVAIGCFNRELKSELTSTRADRIAYDALSGWNDPDPELNGYIQHILQERAYAPGQLQPREELTPAESDALNRYMSDEFSAINQHLRGQPVEHIKLLSGPATAETCEERVPLILSALKKMHPHTPEGISMARWTDLPPELLKRIQESVGGDMVIDPAFMSFSANPVKGGDKFGDHTSLPVKLVVRPSPHSKGVDLRSIRPREREVLFPPGTRFRIVSYEENVSFPTPPFALPNGKLGQPPVFPKTVIELEEI